MILFFCPDVLYVSVCRGLSRFPLGMILCLMKRCNESTFCLVSGLLTIATATLCTDVPCFTRPRQASGLA